MFLIGALPDDERVCEYASIRLGLLDRGLETTRVEKLLEPSTGRYISDGGPRLVIFRISPSLVAACGTRACHTLRVHDADRLSGFQRVRSSVFVARTARRTGLAKPRASRTRLVQGAGSRRQRHPSV